ncbi:glucose 1-dehydrogenase [Arthrobacter sp. IA7]|uniref:glucose 1-dehydrogenase n=1 Tax=Arthrobacter ipis TaxID=2716202 RepID=UPI0016875A80|nr:glucose 1-dehydrogenase [Arthrobacter ipis]MBD1543570.1 glucose 1-dehydrogenase [Arthrobacter ipis]
MNITFENQAALVTGAASGLGLAAARAFAEAGAAVALVDFDGDAVQAAAETLAADGHQAIAIRCDVADEAQVAAAVEQTVAAFGRLDAAFNNAGIQAPVSETADAEGDDFDRVIAVNLRGVWNSMKHELRHMRGQGSGAIVNCSSTGGVVGTAGLGAYNASKHAVIGVTRSAALEYAPSGIRINAICPGVIDTPMVQAAKVDHPEHMAAIIDAIPAKRSGTAEEIASAVLWLCSSGAAFTIGQALVVDGGFTVL